MKNRKKPLRIPDRTSLGTKLVLLIGYLDGPLCGATALLSRTAANSTLWYAGQQSSSKPLIIDAVAAGQGSCSRAVVRRIMVSVPSVPTPRLPPWSCDSVACRCNFALSTMRQGQAKCPQTFGSSLARSRGQTTGYWVTHQPWSIMMI